MSKAKEIEAKLLWEVTLKMWIWEPLMTVSESVFNKASGLYGN